jgi:peptide/nickel transport system substrate-binding protein
MLMRISRRRLGALGLGALPVLLGARAKAAEPKRGGTLVIAIDGDPPTVNPDVTTSVPDVSVGSLVYDALTRLDENFQVVPHLASSWTVSPDQLTYTFNLVTATWHDGKPLTSRDVKFTLETVAAKYGAKFAAAAAHIDTIATPDDRTVVVTLKSPFGPFLFSVSGYTNAAIMPEHIYAGRDVLTNPATLANPIGTGPFMLKEWVRGQTITLVRNPNYWKPGLPYLDQIVFRMIPDTASRILALKAGEVDYIYFYYFSASQYPQVANDPNLQFRERGAPEDHLILFNVRRPPFDDVRVRQALFTAIDREFIKKAVFQNLGTVMQSAINSHLAWAHNPEVNLGQIYPYDPDKAATMLDAAGLKLGPDGTRFELRLVYDSTDAAKERQMQALSSMWGRIGVKLIPQGGTRNVILPQVYTDWNFDATLQAYSTGGDPAIGTSRLYITSAIRKAPFVNASGYSNPDVDKLFATGAELADQAKRAEAYKQVQVILARDLPVFPLWETALINVAIKSVAGKWAWSTGYDYWDEVWIET